MSSAAFEIFKWTLAVVAVGYTIYEFPLLIKKSWVIKVMMLMVLCFPIGKALEFWLVVPQLIRWHLADFVFVPCVAWISWEIPSLSKRLEPWRLWVVTTTAALALAVGVELIELAFQHIEVAKNLPTRGDWGDMASYFISYALFLPIARVQVVNLRSATAAKTAAAADRAERERRAAAETRQARRDRPTRGQPRKPGRAHTRGPVGRRRR